MRGRVLTASGILFLLCLSVFILQPRNTGFEPGHRGWVSSGGLALAAHTRFDNGFVGYMLEYAKPGDQRTFEYFNRFPIFFTVALKGLLSVSDLSLSEQVFLARQLMNLIFCLTLIAVFFLLRALSCTVWNSLGSTAFVGSGYYVVFYKDLIFYDPPALLGIVIFWLTLALYREHGFRFSLWAGALFAVCLSQSGAIFASFLVWLLWEMGGTLRKYRTIHSFANIKSIRVLLVSLALFVSFTFYNIFWEALIRHVSLANTSIVQSFLKRVHYDLLEYEEKVRISNFLVDQLMHFGRGVIPFAIDLNPSFDKFAFIALGLYVIAATAVFVFLRFKHLSKVQKELILIMLFSGPIWIFYLRGLTAFHDYTSIYYLGFYIVFFTMLGRYLVAFEKFVCLIAVLCFISSQYTWARNISRNAAHHNAETADMERIRKLLPRDEPYTVEKGARKIFPHAPYLLGFYLPNNPIWKEERTSYHISRSIMLECSTLTPKNKIIYLYRDCPPQ